MLLLHQLSILFIKNTLKSLVLRRLCSEKPIPDELCSSSAGTERTTGDERGLGEITGTSPSREIQWTGLVALVGTVLPGLLSKPCQSWDGGGVNKSGGERPVLPEDCQGGSGVTKPC